MFLLGKHDPVIFWGLWEEMTGGLVGSLLKDEEKKKKKLRTTTDIG